MKFFDLTKEADLIIKKNILRDLEIFLKKGSYINGKENLLLENKLKKIVGAKYCKVCSSGTDALLISLMNLGLKKGDEVITSPYSWISVAEVVSLLGLKVRFADINLDSFNIDLNHIKAITSKRTKVIIPVSIFGMCSNLIEIKKFTKKNNITLIEDAAQSLGAKILNLNSCNIADISCTSFFPTKILGGYGDGGAIFTNKQSNYKKISKIVNHGSIDRKNFDLVGMNARMDTIQSIFLLKKIKFLKKNIKQRRTIARMYNDFFLENNIYGYQNTNLKNYSVYSQYTILVKNRKKFTNYLKDFKIPYKIYYEKPIYKNKAYFQKIFLKNTEFISKHSVSLPINLYDLNKTKYVIKKLKRISIDKKIFFLKPIS